MAAPDFVLGIDSSTQGTSGVVLDRSSFKVVKQTKVHYRDDPRLYGFLPSGSSAPLLAPTETGEADQPAMMYLAALDALLDDLGPDVIGRVAAVNVSAQQHGQIWLSQDGLDAIASWRAPAGPSATAGEFGLIAFPPQGFARERAPIWMTTSTSSEADHIRNACGGVTGVTLRSGSDSPMRFSGAVLRHIALRETGAYARTRRVHLISSFIAAVLSGVPDAPIDWGNGSGMSLMHWTDRTWDRALADMVARDLPGGTDGLLSRLPRLAHPLDIVGRITPVAAKRFGFNGDCMIIVGSGDNPQTKVLAAGELLSLGTSFVIMTAGTKPHPSANAMYDGLGRPFLFGCRTNGALAWEAVRLRHGLASNDFADSEFALAKHPVGSSIAEFIFQPEHESFPESPSSMPPISSPFSSEYAAIVDSSLSLLYLAAQPFASDSGPVSVAGGASASGSVRARVASIWNRPVVRLSDAGAGAGAAVAAAIAIAPAAERSQVVEQARRSFIESTELVMPDLSAASSLRMPGGYFERLSGAFSALAGRPLVA